MSAFLGPIHYWLYNKIQRVNERAAMLQVAAAECCADLAKELQADVEVIYGAPLSPEADLAEHIDTRNIHGWLQHQITLAETREAAYLNELRTNCGAAAEALAKEVFTQHGKTCAAAAKAKGGYDLQRAQGLYQALNDYFLNGMPCDAADQIIEGDHQRLVWEGPCLQERNWAKGGIDKRLMKSWQQAWLAAFIAELNPAFSYLQTADSLTGDAVNRHEIVRCG